MDQHVLCPGGDEHLQRLGQPDHEIAETLHRAAQHGGVGYIVDATEYPALSQRADPIGEHYVDADGTKYAPMFGQPVMVYAADAARTMRTLNRALSRGVMPAIFTADLFRTGHDAANRSAVASVRQAELDLVGIALRAERKVVDKIVDGLKLHS